MTEEDFKRYETLLRTHVAVDWTNTEVRALLDEVRRLKDLLDVKTSAPLPEYEERPVALRDHWAVTRRFVGGH